MARKRAHGDGRLNGRVRQSLSAHKGYRTKAHSRAEHANAVSKLDDAHDDLCVAAARAVPALPPVPPRKGPGDVRAAAAGLRADYGSRSAAVFRADVVMAVSGPAVTVDLHVHLRDLSDWYRREIDRSAGTARKLKDPVRRHADAVLAANLVGLHYLRLSGLNGDARFAVLAGAGLQRW